MSTGLVEPHGRDAPGFQFLLLDGLTAHVSLGLSACWAGHCQSRPCQVWNPDFPPLGAVIVVPPAAPIGVVTVVVQVVSVVVGLAVVVGLVVAIAVRLRPVLPVPSTGRSVIAHSVIAHHPIDLLRTVPRAVVLSVTDLLAIGPSVTARALRATVVRHSSLATAPPGRMRVEPLRAQRPRNVGPNQPEHTSFGGFVRLSLAESRLRLHLMNRGPRSGRVGG
jgi:hypothetical protein